MVHPAAYGSFAENDLIGHSHAIEVVNQHIVLEQPLITTRLEMTPSSLATKEYQVGSLMIPEGQMTNTTKIDRLVYAFLVVEIALQDLIVVES